MFFTTLTSGENKKMETKDFQRENMKGKLNLKALLHMKKINEKFVCEC